MNEFLTDLIRDINDPEHPMSLEELNVVQITNIDVRYLNNFIVSNKNRDNNNEEDDNNISFPNK